MVIKTHYATESESPFSEGMMVSLGPVTYEQPPLTSQQETSPTMSYRQRIVARKMRCVQNQVTSVSIPQVSQVQPCSQNEVQPQTQSIVQPVSASQVQPQVQMCLDSDPVVPNLGPSMFRRSSKRMSFNSNRNTSNAPESPDLGMQTESPEIIKLRRLRADSIWCGALIMYYSQQNVRFKLSSLQLQELEKFDTEISNIRDNTGKFDCRLLMKKFLLLESYNIPDIGDVYVDGVISKNFPMDLLKMILIRNGRNTDNLSKTQMIRELSSYDRTLLAFTMVPVMFWGPRI